MIGKEEASCIFYCKQYNEENVEVCLLNVKKCPDVTLCYTNNPFEPMLVCNQRVFGAPNRYKLYKTKAESSGVEPSTEKNKENIVLENGSQVVDFMNYSYRPKEEYISDPRYQLLSVYDKDILSTIWKYSHIFDKKTPLGFSQWMNSQNVDLTLTESERKTVKTEGTEMKLRSRQLFVLDDKYHDFVINDIIKVLPNHRKTINDMKKEGYQIIGYCRKSLGDTKNRVLCLQRMVDVLYKRSLVDKVFVSPFSTAKQPFSKRDGKNVKEILSQLTNVHGSTEDFLNFLNKNPKICVISINYAGFTTNCTDLKQLLSSQLLNNPEDLKLFDCRPALKQRGK
ncbi:hypothetical protein G6F56_009789 [Rhizopus delemar]|nr:hypothetical protein G6F56_009789 [Rhizopus delemar]